ncbi:Protein MOTHER of FT and TFL1-like protein 2 [Bienertia sinuspersici]
MVEYMGPQPPTGKHRYVFVLYKQKGPLVKPKPLPPSYARGNFNTRHFVAHNDLLQPAAALYFQAQKEANVAYDI